MKGLQISVRCRKAKSRSSVQPVWPVTTATGRFRARNRPVSVVTGHTGWTDDLDFAFRHRTEVCRPFTRRWTDPEAPYDGYVEDDDTEEKARTVRLMKKKESTSGGT